MEPMMNAMAPLATSGTPAPIQRPMQGMAPTRPDPQMPAEGGAGMSPQMQMILMLLMALMQGGGQGGPGMPMPGGQPAPPMPMPGMAPAGPAPMPPMMPPMGGMGG